MSKILLETYMQSTLSKGKQRLREFAKIQCPDCMRVRNTRYDSYSASASTRCISCTMRRRPLKAAEDKFNQKEYYHTIQGKVFYLYHHQVSRSKKYGWPLPNYTKEQLLEWVLAQPTTIVLFEEWEKANYIKDLAPSIDRLDDYKPYTLANIQLTTWKVNNQKGREWKLKGLNTKATKPVIQRTLEGIFVSQYHSIMEAERQTGIGNAKISSCCRGYRMAKGFQKPVYSAGGFKWEYTV